MSRTFALGDLHGNKKVFEAVLAELGPKDTVFCLGDVVDRGPHGYEILKSILADKRFILLKGNHEDMFADSIKQYSELEGSYDYWHMCNGGQSTIEEWISAGAPMGLLGIINRLPVKYLYVNKNMQSIWLSHAGFDPDDLPFDESEYFWNREHFYEWMDVEKHPNDYIIHGHTPIGHMFDGEIADENPELGPYWYNDGHKCNIDFLAWKNYYTYLLDLDTFEAIKCEVK